jgi:phenylpyruvate tautomerase PptA (4-oxalocrotonate tautomerase family)
MPIMDVTYPQGALTEDQRTELADELTTVLLRAERAPDTDFFREVTWVFVHELPEGTVLTAGRPVEQPIFRVECTTPEGALSDRRREELVAEATRVVREVAGIAEEDAMRIFVLCREIDEGSWGAGGQVIRFEQLREAAKAEREKAEAPTTA